MREQAGSVVYDFHTFRSMDVDQERILSALAAGADRFLPGLSVQVEVECREVERAPVQDYWLPEPSMSPEEFDRLCREAAREFLAAGTIRPAAVQQHTRRLAEVARAYQDVRFCQGSSAVGGSFRPGLITVYLLPGQGRQALTDHLISTLAHETYHAASFRVADRRRGLLRQHLNYQDERGFQVWEEVLACLYAREVARFAGCAAEVESYGVTREFLALGDEVAARVGLDFAALSARWLLTAPGAEAFWDAQGDTLFRSLHMGGAKPLPAGGRI